nr:hypothetical protein [Tanacetum cinerariifolium]
MKENDAILKNMQTNMTSLTNLNLELKNMFGQFIKMNTASSSGSGTFLSNTITTLKEDLKGITTRSGTAYQGPMIPTTSSSLPSIVERETEATKDTVHPTNYGSTKDVQPLVVQTESPILNSQRLLLPSLSPLLLPTLLNEHCSPVLLKKLPEKRGDPGKFLIPCDFLGMDECFALADLGASINLMPLSVWNKLSLPELSPTCMTLELADRLISRPVGVAKDVFVKVETFHFSSDFVVVDFDADPRLPLILRRSFLKTERALIDVFEGELTLRVGKEAITFNLDQTSRYSANYNDMTANGIDVTDMACKEYSHEVLGFSDVITSGNPTPYYDPIVSTSSPTLTPFGESDLLLEEVNAFLSLEDDPTSPEVDQYYLNPEGEILLHDAFLNDDPSLPPLNQGNGGNLTANRFKFKIKRCSPSGSIRRPVAEKRPSSQNFGVKLIEVEDDVNSFNKEGGSSAASEHVNLDAGYDSSFEDGSSKEPNVARGRRKKKSKKVSELGELEEIMKNAITNIAAQENQGPTMEECHEKLKSMRLEPDDPIYLAATGNVGALDETLIHASVPSHNKRKMRLLS